jgi:hypothetical protein
MVEVVEKFIKKWYNTSVKNNKSGFAKENNEELLN